jgi:hypothetical protein
MIKHLALRRPAPIGIRALPSDCLMGITRSRSIQKRFGTHQARASRRSSRIGSPSPLGFQTVEKRETRFAPPRSSPSGCVFRYDRRMNMKLPSKHGVRAAFFHRHTVCDSRSAGYCSCGHSSNHKQQPSGREDRQGKRARLTRCCSRRSDPSRAVQSTARAGSPRG